MVNDVRLISFYLPQFHPTPENNEWWGKGFTEWTNTTKAEPLFVGHYQPHLPTDLGFYDLRLRQSRHEQIKLAKQYGISAFCYHYYWFSGTRLLHEPIDDMLADPGSDMPFCLCWANENWTRRWDAAEDQILIAQKYQPGDDLAFIQNIVPHFKDERYVRINGAPLLLVYRPQHLPDAKKSLRIWRDYCASVGISKLQLACALTHGNTDYEQFGFDAGVEFPPHRPLPKSLTEDLHFYEEFSGHIFDYKDIATAYLDRRYKSPSVYRGVFPSWDNTARRGSRAFVTLNGTPENYEYWLNEAVSRTRQDSPGCEPIVFINAWNEWAEGCHLEPDRKYGRRFLEATLRVANGTSVLTGFSQTGRPKSAKAKSSLLAIFGGSRSFGGSSRAPVVPEAVQPLAARSAIKRSRLVQARLNLRGVLARLLEPFPTVRQPAATIYRYLFDRAN